MQNRLRWDNRRSGRTTKMLAAAMRQCFSGRHVYVVIPHGQFFGYCVPILQDMGANRVYQSNHMVDFGSDCQIHFVDLTSALIGDGFSLRDIPDENVFWDHEAVKRKYNQILQRYHEYD